MHSNTDGKLSIIFERENVTLSKNMNNNNQSLSLSSEKVKSTTAVCVSAEGCFVFLQPELTRFDGTSATFDFFRSADWDFSASWKSNQWVTCGLCRKGCSG